MIFHFIWFQVFKSRFGNYIMEPLHWIHPESWQFPGNQIVAAIDPVFPKNFKALQRLRAEAVLPARATERKTGGDKGQQKCAICVHHRRNDRDMNEKSKKCNPRALKCFSTLRSFQFCAFPPESFQRVSTAVGGQGWSRWALGMGGINGQERSRNKRSLDILSELESLLFLNALAHFQDWTEISKDPGRPWLVTWGRPCGLRGWDTHGRSLGLGSQGRRAVYLDWYVFLAPLRLGYSCWCLSLLSYLFSVDWWTTTIYRLIKYSKVDVEHPPPQCAIDQVKPSRPPALSKTILSIQIA